MVCDRAPPGFDVTWSDNSIACCNIWGQCGITEEYCTPIKLNDTAPGASAPGEDACISNCGTDIKQSQPPAQPMSIGYFEAFNIDRSCLVMDASQIPTKGYTHIHFAFANISDDYKVRISLLDHNNAQSTHFRIHSSKSLALLLLSGIYSLTSLVPRESCRLEAGPSRPQSILPPSLAKRYLSKTDTHSSRVLSNLLAILALMVLTSIGSIQVHPTYPACHLVIQKMVNAICNS